MAAVQDFASTLARLRPVIAGSQSGARVRVELIAEGAVASARDLGEGVYRIGARSDCDLIIPEASAPHIATLKVEKAKDGHWTLSLVPFTDDLTLDGKPLAGFNPIAIRDAATLAAGSTQLRFTPLGLTSALSGLAKAAGQRMASAGDAGRFGSLNGPPIPGAGNAPGKSLLTPKRLLLVAGLLFGAALLSTFWDAIGASGSGGAGGPVASEPKIEAPTDVIRLVRQELAAADLADHIRARLEAGAVVLEGAVSARQEDRYRSLLPALRRRSAVEIRSNVRPVATPLQSQIAAVALEPMPMVIMQSGERFQVGDTMPSDWRVESITSQGVVISRGTLRETIALGGGR